LPFCEKKKGPITFFGNQNLPDFEKIKWKYIDLYLKALVGSHNKKCFE
jgi:hypothetical protein